MIEIDKLLEGLNPIQIEAVTTSAKNTLIIASPGAGKTMVLSKRIAYLIANGVDPESILAITFTNKATKEMKSRIHSLVGSRIDKCWIGTFHAICLKIIRIHGLLVNIKPGFTILDEKDQLKLFRQAMKDTGITSTERPEYLLDKISSFKSRLLTPQLVLEESPNSPLSHYYHRYQELLQENNCLDFDEMQMKAVQLLELYPSIKDSFRNKFEYIFIDELQDTCDVQFHLIRLLTGDSTNLYTVGDPEQCLLPDTLIETSQGKIPISALAKNAELVVASGHGTTTSASVNRIMSRQHKGTIITLKTESGATITGTPEHCIFTGPVRRTSNSKTKLIMFGATTATGHPHFSLLDNREYISWDYDKLWEAIKDESPTLEAKLIDSEEVFEFLPLCLARIGMSVPVLDKGKIVEDIILEIETSEYNGLVYDLSIPDYRNYIANGIVVHNSIYMFRNANVNNLYDLQNEYDSQIIKMEQNYRSTKTIVNAANAVISNNNIEFPKTIWTENQEGINLACYSASDETDEANFVTSVISRTLSLEPERSFADFTILYRTNQQARVIEETFLKNNFPYQIIGNFSFFQRKEIKDIIAYLKLINNEYDSISLKRIINVPKRSIGDTTLRKIEEYAYYHNISFIQALDNIEIIAAESKISQKTVASIRAFSALIRECREYMRDHNLSELVNFIWNNTQYIELLFSDGTEDSMLRVDNLKELHGLIEKYEEEEEDLTLNSFLNSISLYTDQDYIIEANSIKMMTVHSSKGLEFPIVFIVGLEEGVFPHARSIANAEELEEERRLFYVAITRAKEKVYLSHSKYKALLGQSAIYNQSRFINEIPENLIKVVD